MTWVGAVDRLEQGRGPWSGVGRHPGVCGGHCTWQCIVASRKTLHLISGAEIDKLRMSLGYFYRLDTVSHAADGVSLFALLL